MFASSDYELLDFGAGRKLERFASVILDRPSPPAEGAQCSRPELWADAWARFEVNEASKSGSSRGRWIARCEPPPTWNIGYGDLQFELKLTDFGHVGLFPEQAANWDWISQRIRTVADAAAPIRILNLFAYTGGSTLAAATAGAAITHVDAARNVVAWARRNADLSALSAAPIRWIVEDAMKFARRELKRGQQYDAVILDPPSYGHGPKGETWKLAEQLPDLLSICHELTRDQLQFVLLTSHAADFGSAELAACLIAAGFAQTKAEIEADDLWLASADGRRLHAGSMARMATSAASARPHPGE